MIRWPKRCGSSLPNRHRPARRLPKIYPIISADFWLVVASPHPAEAIKIQGPVALSFFFRHSNRRPKRRVNVLSTRSSPAASPIKLPPCRRHHRSVHCCVDPTSGGHPRPVLRPSLIFRWAPFRCPKQGNPQQRARTRARAGRLCLNGCDVVVVEILVLRLFFPRQIVRDEPRRMVSLRLARRQLLKASV